MPAGRPAARRPSGQGLQNAAVAAGSAANDRRWAYLAGSFGGTSPAIRNEMISFLAEHRFEQDIKKRRYLTEYSI